MWLSGHYVALKSVWACTKIPAGLIHTQEFCLKLCHQWCLFFQCFPLCILLLLPTGFSLVYFQHFALCRNVWTLCMSSSFLSVSPLLSCWPEQAQDLLAIHLPVSWVRMQPTQSLRGTTNSITKNGGSKMWSDSVPIKRLSFYLYVKNPHFSQIPVLSIHGEACFNIQTKFVIPRSNKSIKSNYSFIW